METPSTIADLNPLWPLNSESRRQGDDHLRAIKSAIKSTFPNVAATVSAGATELNLAHAGGTISGALTVKSALSVGGAVVFGSLFTANGAGNNFAGEMSISGAVSMARSLTVSGTAVFKTGIKITTSGGLVSALASHHILAGESVGTGTSKTQALAGTVERIEVALMQVSLSGTDNLRIQLGTGGVLSTSGYDTMCGGTQQGGFVVTPNIGTQSFPLTTSANAAQKMTGIITFTRMTGHNWIGSGVFYSDQAPNSTSLTIAGLVALVGAVDIVGIAPAGTNTLDGGYWQVSYYRSA